MAYSQFAPILRRIQLRRDGDRWQWRDVTKLDWSRVYDDRWTCERAALRVLDVPMRDVVFEVEHG